MKRILSTLLLSGLLIPAINSQAASSIGGGITYNRFVDDVDFDDLDQDAYSYNLALREKTSGLGYEFALEIQPEEITGTGENAYIPQIFALAGDTLYLGAGTGIPYTDGEFDDFQFYLRAGLDLQLVPGLYLDLHARYTFRDNFEASELKDIDGDTLTLGANLRLKF